MEQDKAKEYKYAASHEDVEEVEVELKAQDRQAKEEERRSKKLSQLLRHDKNGNLIRLDGWAKADQLCRIMKCTEADLMKVVCSNNKSRFAWGKGETSGRTYIRANQGHSIPVQLNSLKRAPDDVKALHGTYLDCIDVIKKNGLSKMKRQHIHMAQGMPGTVISGMRKTAEVVIHIDVPKCRERGIEFYVSANGVVLSEGNSDGVIPPDCFLNIEYTK